MRLFGEGSNGIQFLVSRGSVSVTANRRRDRPREHPEHRHGGHQGQGLLPARVIVRIGLALSLSSFLGCSKPSKLETDTAELPEADTRKGEQIFQMRCFVCHGRSGKGDGPSAQGLGTRVRDLTDPTWQNSISDKSVAQAIRSGAKAIGGSTAMPPNPDLTEEQIRCLIRYIRNFRETR